MPNMKTTAASTGACGIPHSHSARPVSTDCTSAVTTTPSATLRTAWAASVMRGHATLTAETKPKSQRATRGDLALRIKDRDQDDDEENVHHHHADSAGDGDRPGGRGARVGLGRFDQSVAAAGRELHASVAINLAPTAGNFRQPLGRRTQAAGRKVGDDFRYAMRDIEQRADRQPERAGSMPAG